MSMLAERKRKQKFNLNPRGKLWSDDSNKFGQKMLEKMGWSSGKGLGAKEDGMTEHVKQTYKNDVSGIGFKDTEDQWTKHEAEFTSLLQNLTGDKVSETTPQISLEKKSQSSRKRVHYHKFTRGKDLSLRSEKDIAQIFGKKSLKDKPKEEPETNEPDDKNFGVTTVHGGNMADYFKSKMGALAPKIDQNSDDERPSFSMNGTNGERPSFNPNGNESDTDERPSFNIDESTKKKNVSDNKPTDDIELKDVSTLGLSSLNIETPTKENKSLKKKKKKTKVVITECFDNAGFVDFSKEELKNGNTFDNPGFDENFGETPSKKRKLETITEEEEMAMDDGLKRKKKKGGNIEEEIVGEETTKKKKKSKKTVQETNSEENVIENQTEDSNKKEGGDNKKKKKKKSKDIDEITNDNVGKESKMEGIENPTFNDTIGDNPEDSISEGQKKKKKSKKNKVDGIDNLACTEINDSAVPDLSEELTGSGKKRKKKSKNGIENPGCISSEVIDTVEPLRDSVENTNEVIRKKSKKRKSNEEILTNGVDNPACIANSIEQRIQETIASVSDAVDEYQLELENKINEGKEHEKKAQDIWNSLRTKTDDVNDIDKNIPKDRISNDDKPDVKNFNNTKSNFNGKKFNRRFDEADKKSVKNVIQGEPRLNFRGANLFKLAGYGIK